MLLELIIFEAFFVLTSLYDVPQDAAARKLSKIVSFRGIEMRDKPTMARCLALLEKEKIDLADAYFLAYGEAAGIEWVFSFDKDLSKRGMPIKPPA